MAANLAGGAVGLVGYLKTQALQSNPSPFMAGLAQAAALDAGGKQGCAAQTRGDRRIHRHKRGDPTRDEQLAAFRVRTALA
jgi:hypothetical protein